MKGGKFGEYSRRSILGSLSRIRRADFHKPSLDEEVPYSARFIHVDLDEVPRFAPPKLATASCVLSYKCLLDDEIRLGEDA